MSATPRKRRKPITVAEAGRRAWKGTTKAQRAEIMRRRLWARWHWPCGQRRNRVHQEHDCAVPACAGRKEPI